MEPLVPECPDVPADGEHMRNTDVESVLEYQSKLLLEDRELILGIVLLVCITSGTISDSRCEERR